MANLVHGAALIPSAKFLILIISLPEKNRLIYSKTKHIYTSCLERSCTPQDLGRSDMVLQALAKATNLMFAPVLPLQPDTWCMDDMHGCQDQTKPVEEISETCP